MYACHDGWLPQAGHGTLAVRRRRVRVVCRPCGCHHEVRDAAQQHLVGRDIQRRCYAHVAGCVAGCMVPTTPFADGVGNGQEAILNGLVEAQSEGADMEVCARPWYTHVSQY